jgi:hypothetical protein
MNSTFKIALLAFAALCAGLVWAMIPSRGASAIAFTQFMAEVDRGSVQGVTIEGTDLHGMRRDGSIFQTTTPENSRELIKTLNEKGVSVTYRDIRGGGWSAWLIQIIPVVFAAWLVYLLPAAFILVAVILITRSVSRQRSPLGELNR